MKKFMITTILVALFAAGTKLQAQDQSLGLPGDNLNLYAVMKMFQESETLEGFEKNLNEENSRINNLDLDGDNFVDYIRVIDFVDRDVHNIVLQVAVNEKENQDVAVFTVQRDSYGRVQIQLTGDEALYGRNYIIEPIFDDEVSGQTPNPGYLGNTRTIDGRNVTINRTTTVEISAWPLVRFLYLPGYVTWRSNWYYGYYPPYWRSWRPYYWDYYYGYHYNMFNNYYGHYRRWDNHRYTRWNDFYYADRRSHSANVSRRIEAGNYKSTYSRPDLRRRGEAMYHKTNPSQDRRRPSYNSSGNRMERRSNSRSDNGGGTITNRRSSTTERNNSGVNVPSRQNANENRRSTTTERNNSGTNVPSRQNVNENRRRSATPERNNSDANVPSRQNANENRRSATPERNSSDANVQSRENATDNRRSGATVTNRSVTKTEPGQKASTNREPRQSSTRREGSASRRSSGSTKSETTVQQNGKAKESETTKSTRRR